MQETWKDIPGYNGFYQISNLGKVKSIKKGIITGYVIKGGYKRVTLYKNNKYKKFMVHRLVAQLFIKNPDNKPEIDHVDGNPLNNVVENLRWVSHEENVNNPITLKKKVLPLLAII